VSFLQRYVGRDLTPFYLHVHKGLHKKYFQLFLVSIFFSLFPCEQGKRTRADIISVVDRIPPTNDANTGRSGDRTDRESGCVRTKRLLCLFPSINNGRNLRAGQHLHPLSYLLVFRSSSIFVILLHQCTRTKTAVSHEKHPLTH
jgi:hypothetical protein